jgi:hypothetical protein
MYHMQEPLTDAGYDCVDGCILDFATAREIERWIDTCLSIRHSSEAHHRCGPQPDTSYSLAAIDTYAVLLIDDAPRWSNSDARSSHVGDVRGQP